MSDWIRVHAQLINRPVVARCAECLRIDPFKAIGHLVTFWGAAAEHARGGHVAQVSDATLERWAGWTGKRGAFAKWLRSDHVDDAGRIREWDEYQGTLDARRERDRERKRRERGRVTSAGHPSDSRSDVRVTSAPTGRNGTERDGTGRDETGQTTLPPDTPRAREDVRETLTAPQRLAIAANQAIEAKWGEQTRPLLPGHGPTVQLAEELNVVGIPLAFAEASIARQVQAKADGPPRSLAYFRAGIGSDWEAHAVRTQAAQLPAVPALEATTRPASRHALGVGVSFLEVP